MRNRALALALPVLCAGCFAGTPQTTAYPVPRGKVEWLCSLHGVVIANNLTDAAGFTGGASARLGLGHNMDVGVRLSSVYAAADFKLTLWKDSIAAVALLPRVQGTWPLLALLVEAPVLFTARFGDVVSVNMMGGYRHLLSNTIRAERLGDPAHSVNGGYFNVAFGPLFAITDGFGIAPEISGSYPILGRAAPTTFIVSGSLGLRFGAVRPQFQDLPE